MVDVDVDKLYEARTVVFNDLVNTLDFLVKAEGLTVDKLSRLMGRGDKWIEQRFLQHSHFRLCDISDIATMLGYKVEIHFELMEE